MPRSRRDRDPASPAGRSTIASRPTAPRRAGLWTEARTLGALARIPTALAFARPARGAARARPVIVVPGYGTGDGATALLRRYLTARGLRVEGWGLGVNRAGLDIAHELGDVSAGWALSAKTPYRREAGVALLADRLGDAVAERARALGGPVSLVGWSLGGTIAREVARDRPEVVDRVVTLGSPVIGGPKYTAAAAWLRSRGLDLDWIEQHVERRESRPIERPIVSLVSRSDAIVAYEAAIDRVSRNVRVVEVDVAHSAFAFDPRIWALVYDALTR